jgi:hypothetical protein
MTEFDDARQRFDEAHAQGDLALDKCSRLLDRMPVCIGVSLVCSAAGVLVPWLLPALPIYTFGVLSLVGLIPPIVVLVVSGVYLKQSRRQINVMDEASRDMHRAAFRRAHSAEMEQA